MSQANVEIVRRGYKHFNRSGEVDYGVRLIFEGFGSAVQADLGLLRTHTRAARSASSCVPNWREIRSISWASFSDAVTESRVINTTSLLPRSTRQRFTRRSGRTNLCSIRQLPRSSTPSSRHSSY